ncbi:hypothetical protein FKM82_016199 [Ascaphus truei]
MKYKPITMIGVLWLLTHLQLGTSLNPNDPNVCSYWESFTTAVKESYAHPYSQISTESCDSVWSHFKTCTQQRIMYRTAYRHGVKLDYRKRYRCCQGYYESEEVCVRNCEMRCTETQMTPKYQCPAHCRVRVGGSVDQGTGECMCPPGWMGPICSIPCPRALRTCREECPIGKYGQDCSETCDCVNGVRCFHINGACLCEAGFYGASCEERMCPAGLHGVHCNMHCQCDPMHTQSCHPMNGECTCKAGWAGLHCNETCPHGYYGTNCQEPCLCLNGGTCDSETGSCLCSHGFTGQHCSSYCPDGRYGANCSTPCECKNFLACSPIDGTCICKEGWQRGACSVPCPKGTWGFNCNGTCKCDNGASCSPITGLCFCTSGWSGDRCDQPCKNGTFGPGCNHQCECRNSDRCDPGTGQCQCLPGWTGVHCEQGCEEGYWGRNCNMSCPCKNGATCSPEDGSCTCTAGFRGPACQRPCLPGRYGKKCALVCKCSNYSMCHHVDGSCECFPGWIGNDCSQSCTPGFWGEDCISTCYCQHGGHCSPADGTCTCPPGWTGKYCSEVCPLGSYGENCIHKCRCQNGAECDQVTGKCSCLPGYHGGFCEMKCPARTYGLRCHQVCDCLHNSTCDHVTGSCQCDAGWSGTQSLIVDLPITVVPKTSAGTDSLGTMIGIIALVILVVALIAFFLCYRHWQKDKESRSLAVAYTTTRTASSEYEVPDVPTSYMHYYSNPSYHTLSQCGPSPPPVPSNQERPSSVKIKLTYVLILISGGYRMDRSYSYSNGAGIYYNKDYVKGSTLNTSNSSLNSENPYATIKDLPMLLAKHPEGSYMEMKSPALREMSYAEIGLFDDPPMCQQDLKEEESFPRGAEGVTPSPLNSLPANHYDSPKNSHIPSHYDMPPVRHYPPSPLAKRQAR